MAYDWIVDALEETWSSIEQSLQGRSDRSLDVETPCPGWSVRDVVNHLIGAELHSARIAAPDSGIPGARGKNESGEMNEAFVASRRHVRIDQLVGDFHETTQRALQHLRMLRPEECDDNGDTLAGPLPAHRYLESRVVDSWIHLQDIHDAFLEPTDDHGTGEQIVINRFEAMLPYLWARRTRAPEGALLRVHLVGRLGRHIQVQVREGHGVAVLTSDAAPLVEVNTAVSLFWRRMAGRINAEAFLAASATGVLGDRTFATRLAESMNVLR